MRTDYRERAIECFQLAHETPNPQHGTRLLNMAFAWMRLHDQAEKNAKADLTYETPLPRPREQTVPQQQQQQQRAKNES
jgi:hypothetical protein